MMCNVASMLIQAVTCSKRVETLMNAPSHCQNLSSATPPHRKCHLIYSMQISSGFIMQGSHWNGICSWGGVALDLILWFCNYKESSSSPFVMDLCYSNQTNDSLVQYFDSPSYIIETIIIACWVSELWQVEKKSSNWAVCSRRLKKNPPPRCQTDQFQCVDWHMLSTCTL